MNNLSKLLILLIIIVVVIIIIEIYLIKYKSRSILTASYNVSNSQYYNEVNIEDSTWISKITFNRLYILVPIYNGNIKILKKRLHHIIQFVPESIVIVYGYDSTLDSTVNDLYSWQQEVTVSNDLNFSTETEMNDSKRFYYFPQPLTNIKHLPRTVKLGKIRNYLQQLAINHCRQMKYSDSDNDFVLVYDGDHQGCLSKVGLLDSIAHIQNGDYDIAAAYGTADFIGVHFPYDSYALRMKDKSWSTPGNILDLLSIMMGNNIYPVWSAFSGATVYRYNDFVMCKYSEEKDFCEHVGLHQELNRHGLKMVINKKMHIYVGHQPSVS